MESLQSGEWAKLRERQNQNNRSAILVVLSKSMANNQRTAWRWYALTAEQAKAWLPAACHALNVTITAKDSSGHELLEDTFELQRLGIQETNVRHRSEFVYSLAPFFLSPEFVWYVPEFTYHRLIPASEEEISGVKTLTCTLENGGVQRMWGLED